MMAVFQSFHVLLHLLKSLHGRQPPSFFSTIWWKTQPWWMLISLGWGDTLWWKLEDQTGWEADDWQGLETVNPSEDTTSGNSERRLEMQLRGARSLALRWAAVGSWEAGRMMEVEVGESALRTLLLDTSYRRLCYLWKSAPSIGIATRASWKGKSKLWFPKVEKLCVNQNKRVKNCLQ